MHYKLLIIFSLALSLAAGCSRDDATTVQTSENIEPTVAEPTMPDAHNSKNSLDWPGSYSGVVPCASCPGINTRITLHTDGTFDRSMLYIDESPTPKTDSANFTWNAAGSKVTLGEGDNTQHYQVGENQLFQLDRSGERITGDLAGQYILQQHLRDPAVEDQLWKLVELRGQPLESSRATLTLRAEDSVASGNTSCNTFTGAYAIKSGQRIHMDPNTAMTMMVCPDMTTEATFLEVLQQADNYAIGPDRTLSLNKGRMAPLARFVPNER